jgi:hypothetical protein
MLQLHGDTKVLSEVPIPLVSVLIQVFNEGKVCLHLLSEGDILDLTPNTNTAILLSVRINGITHSLGKGTGSSLFMEGTVSLKEVANAFTVKALFESDNPGQATKGQSVHDFPNSG